MSTQPRLCIYCDHSVSEHRVRGDYSGFDIVCSHELSRRLRFFVRRCDCFEPALKVGRGDGEWAPLRSLIWEEDWLRW